VEYEYTHEYIANAFWKQRIAKVSSVTLIPYIKGEWVYYIAYINIECWCDSENAYNFIKKLNDPHKETRLVHHEDNWWSVEQTVNTFAIRDATVSFEPSYYERFIQEDQENQDREDQDEDQDEDTEELTSVLTEETNFDYAHHFASHPICGSNNSRYTITEAEKLIYGLKKEIKNTQFPYSIQREINKLEEEVKKYRADKEWFQTAVYA
jgi:hypothetical protein